MSDLYAVLHSDGMYRAAAFDPRRIWTSKAKQVGVLGRAILLHATGHRDVADQHGRRFAVDVLAPIPKGGPSGPPVLLRTTAILRWVITRQKEAA